MFYALRQPELIIGHWFCRVKQGSPVISPASSKLVNSMFGEFQSPSPDIVLHPVDAAARGDMLGLAQQHQLRLALEYLAGDAAAVLQAQQELRGPVG